MKLLLFATLLHLTAALKPTSGPVLLKPQVACGSRLPPCPQHSYCLPSKSCFHEDRSKCHGACAEENKYEACSDKNYYIKRCAVDDEECIDDYRDRDSCGTVCGRPGICVPRWLPFCKTGANHGCPKGFWCYADLKSDCKPGQAGCPGRCL